MVEMLKTRLRVIYLKLARADFCHPIYETSVATDKTFIRV